MGYPLYLPLHVVYRDCAHLSLDKVHTHSSIVLTLVNSVLMLYIPLSLSPQFLCWPPSHAEWHTEDVRGASGRQQSCSHTLPYSTKVHPRLRQEERQRWRQGAPSCEGGNEEGTGGGHKGPRPWDQSEGSV